jgi:hypothetical protein
MIGGNPALEDFEPTADVHFRKSDGPLVSQRCEVDRGDGRYVHRAERNLDRSLSLADCGKVKTRDLPLRERNASTLRTTSGSKPPRRESLSFLLVESSPELRSFSPPEPASVRSRGPVRALHQTDAPAALRAGLILVGRAILDKISERRGPVEDAAERR